MVSVDTWHPGMDATGAAVRTALASAAGCAHAPRMRVTILPNGLQVRHISPVGETQYIYREIFEERVYLQAGISLPDDACVLDVGANIGMFTLFVTSLHPRARVLAFEPTPPIFGVLRHNVEAHQLDGRVQLFNHGLSERNTDAELTYYPNVPGNSTLRPEEKEAVKAVAKRELLERGWTHAPLVYLFLLLLFPLRRRIADWMVERVYRGVRHPCSFRVLSDVLEEQAVTRVDLLKIDVEGAELDVLRGIRDEHWPRIRQVTMELHDVDGRLATATALLRRHGFEVSTTQDALSAMVATYNVYATRKQPVVEDTANAPM